VKTVSVSYTQWEERLVYGLLFMLPVAGISVRHWISATFTILLLLALPHLFKKRTDLFREERIFVAILAVFFIVFLVTSLINGWEDIQTRHLGKELRVLLVIPVYLMLRQHPAAGVWLIRGGMLGAFAVLAQSIYDLQVLGLDRAQGIYSPNLLGPFSALLAFWALVAWRRETERKVFRVLIPAVFIAALSGVALSGSRGAYVGLIGVAVVWAVATFKGRNLGLAAAAIAVALSVTYGVSDKVAVRVDTAAGEFKQFLEIKDHSRVPGRLGSVATRVEMWRVSALIFKDNPIWGVGRGNYTAAAKNYVDQGLVHFEVAEHSHPHSAFLEMLVSKGIVGLAVFLALLFYPLIYFIKTFKASRETARLGIIHSVGFMLFSLTDASTFIKGNFISIYLLYLTTFFAWHVRIVRAQVKANG
jgi:O-antigen ligase